MKGEFTAIIQEAPEGGYWAMCPEVPGANGQGELVRLVEKEFLEQRRRFQETVSQTKFT